jgi:hypothetical protein
MLMQNDPARVSVNKWGIASVVALIASVATTEGIVAITGERSTVSVLPALGLSVLALGLSMRARRGGSRWWYVATIASGLFVVLCLIALGGE